MCLVGVVVRRCIDFLILLIPTPLVSTLFCSSIPTFCSFLNVFRSLTIYTVICFTAYSTIISLNNQLVSMINSTCAGNKARGTPDF